MHARLVKANNVDELEVNLNNELSQLYSYWIVDVKPFQTPHGQAAIILYVTKRDKWKPMSPRLRRYRRATR